MFSVSLLRSGGPRMSRFLRRKGKPRSGIISATRRPTTWRASRRPQLERLEERCLLSAGGLDPTFGGDGIVTTDFSDTYTPPLVGLESGADVAMHQGKI